MSFGRTYRVYTFPPGKWENISDGRSPIKDGLYDAPKQLLPEPDFTLEEIERANEELLRDRD